MSKLKLKAGIMASASFHMAPAAVVGAIPLAIAHYNTGATLMQSVFALPTLAAVPMSLIIGSLAGRTGKKIPLQLGILAMLLGGSIIALFDLPLAGLIAAMTVMGLGLGCVMTLGPGLIADHFQGNEQSKVMAHLSAFANVGGMAMAAVGGVLLVYDWHMAFWALLFAVPIFIICQICLPKDKPEKAAEGEKSKIKINSRVVLFCAMTFIIGLNQGIRAANAGLLVLEHGLGDPSIANYAMTFWTAASITICFCFGAISKVIGKAMLPLFIGIFALGMVLIGSAQSIWVFYLGHVLGGMGIATSMPIIISLSARSVNSKTSTFAISMIFATLNGSGFLAPIIVNSIAGVIGDVTAQVCYYIGAVLMAILLTFSILFVRRNKDLVE